MSTFIAKWRGECAACPEPIYKGQEACFDGNNEIVHVDCGPQDITPKAICETCWLEKPCECDDDAPPASRRSRAG